MKANGKSLTRLLVITGVLVWLVMSGLKASAVPHIEIDQPRWDFGVVSNLTELRHDFVIRNSGDAPLLITKVVSSCSVCLRAAVDKTQIAPGEKTLLHGCLDLRFQFGSGRLVVDCTCHGFREVNANSGLW